MHGSASENRRLHVWPCLSGEPKGEATIVTTRVSHRLVSLFSVVPLARPPNCLYRSLPPLIRSRHHSGIIHPGKINLSTTGACGTSITSSLGWLVRWLGRVEEEEALLKRSSKRGRKKKESNNLIEREVLQNGSKVQINSTKQIQLGFALLVMIICVVN